MTEELSVSIYKGYYKVLQKGWKHFTYQYSLGYNAYDGKISEETVDGLHFCELLDVPKWVNLYDEPDVICRVKLTPNSHVIQTGKRSFKTDRFELFEPCSIEEFLWKWFNPYGIILKYPQLIRFIRYPNVVLNEDAVKCDGHLLRHVKAGQQYVEVVLAAIKQNPFAIQHCIYQSTELVEEAVRRCGLVIHWIRRQTPELCLMAVRQNGLALAGVRNQTPEICFEAVKQNGYALQFVKEQTEWICVTAMKQNPRAEQFLSDKMRAYIPPYKLIRNGKIIVFDKTYKSR